MNKYLIRQRKNGDFYFILTAYNGAVLCVSQDYSTLTGCYNGIESVRKHSQTLDIEEDLKVKEYDIG